MDFCLIISSKVPWILQDTDTADSTSASTPTTTTTTVYIGTSTATVQSCSPATTVFTGSTTTATTTVQNCSPTVPSCQSISVSRSTIVPAAEPDCGRHRSFSGPDRNSSEGWSDPERRLDCSQLCSEHSKWRNCKLENSLGSSCTPRMVGQPNNGGRFLPLMPLLNVLRFIKFTFSL